MRDTKIEAAQKKRRAYWPVLGFLMLVALGGISYFAGPAIVDWLDRTNLIRGFPPADVPNRDFYGIVSVMTFAVLAMFASLIVAATLPKKKSVVNEKMIAKERADRLHDIKVKKMRQKMMNEQNRPR
jgi:hypothetical protein